MNRPFYVVNAAHPGSDLAAEAAAMLGLSAMVFTSSDPTYSALLRTKAELLYSFAKTYRGSYKYAITDAAMFYGPSDGDADDLAWAAAVLYRLTGTAAYLTDAQSFAASIPAGWAVSWGEKNVLAQMQLYLVSGSAAAKTKADAYFNDW